MASKSEVKPNYYIDLCKAIADRVELSSDEAKFLFDFKMEEPETVTPTSMRLVVEEGRPIKFQEKGPILEVLGENQSGKTFTILYLSNLLGYDFFDEENSKFLADENVVKQGQEVFRRLRDGVKAKLEVFAEQNILSISTKDGYAEVAISRKKKSVSRKFDLKTQSNAFRDYVKRFIDAQFVSKGRNFDGQLLIDICVQLRKCLETVHNKTDGLIAVYTDKLDELAAGRTIDELHTARTVIDGEIKQLNATLGELENSLAGIRSKLNIIEEIFGKLTKLEKVKAFKVRRSIAQLQEKLPSAEVGQLLDQLKSIEGKLSIKEGNYDAIESEFAGAISGMTQKSHEFSDKDRLASFLSVLRARDIDLLIEKREQYDSSTYAVVEEIYDKIKDYDKNIRLPSELGGSVESLQVNAEKAKAEVRDHSLIKSLTESLVAILNKHQINSSTIYRTLKDEVEGLKENASQLKEKIAAAGTLSKTELNKIQRKLESLKKEFAGLDQAEKNKIAELENTIQSFENLRPIPYSPNWRDELLKLKLAREEELRKGEEKQEQLKRNIEESRKRLLEINRILSSPELTTYSEGVDRLNKISAILTTLAKILERKENLINRELAQDEFDYLNEYGVPPLLDDTINKIFLNRCKCYFNISEENECQIFEIRSFDYRNKQFSCDDVQRRVIDISGGTASIMTVLSLGTRATDSMFGKVLLIDEFHDVAGVLRRETYSRLPSIRGISFAFFAKPVDGLELTVRRVEVTR